MRVTLGSLLRVLPIAALMILAGCSTPRSHYDGTWLGPKRCPEQATAGIVYFNDWSTDPARATCKPVSEFAAVLDSAYRYIDNTEALDNLVLFIHGRGKHPQKLIDQQLLSRLQSENSAVAIALHWPSYAGFLGYADESARAAAKDLETVLATYAERRATQLRSGKTTPTTLLVHSMGNIVFRAWASQTNPGRYDATLFDTIIQNAPDIPPTGLGEWLADLRLSEQHYVTVNRDDRVLQASQQLFGQGERLGRCMPRSGRPDHIYFFDFSATSVGHRYYVDRRRSPGVTLFYEHLLNGHPLPIAAGVERGWYHAQGANGRTYAVTPHKHAAPVVNWCSG